jgi:Ca2+-binding RTX toxin-like protein
LTTREVLKLRKGIVILISISLLMVISTLVSVNVIETGYGQDGDPRKPSGSVASSIMGAPPVVIISTPTFSYLKSDNGNEQEKTKNRAAASSSGYDYVCSDDVGSALSSSNKVAGKFLDQSNSFNPKTQMGLDCSSSESLGEGLASGEGEEGYVPIDNLILCNIPVLPIDICEGTNDDDQIVGTAGADIIYAKDGDDEVQAQSGDDIIYGQDDDDTLQGGSGSDRIYGLDGDDFLYGDTGGNLLTGGGGNYLGGGKGNDVLVGFVDSDVMKGGPGRDYFDCNEGTDQILDFNPDEDTKTQNCEFF